jgi:hypothetical protein
VRPRRGLAHVGILEGSWTRLSSTSTRWRTCSGSRGAALLRVFSGAHDREFALERFREIRELLESAEELGDGVTIRPITTRESYALEVPTYDEPGNQLLEIEEPVVREILDGFRRRPTRPGAATRSRSSGISSSPRPRSQRTRI